MCTPDDFPPSEGIKGSIYILWLSQTFRSWVAWETSKSRPALLFPDLYVKPLREFWFYPVNCIYFITFQKHVNEIKSNDDGVSTFPFGFETWFVWTTNEPQTFQKQVNLCISSSWRLFQSMQGLYYCSDTELSINSCHTFWASTYTFSFTSTLKDAVTTSIWYRSKLKWVTIGSRERMGGDFRYYSICSGIAQHMYLLKASSHQPSSWRYHTFWSIRHFYYFEYPLVC